RFKYSSFRARPGHIHERTCTPLTIISSLISFYSAYRWVDFRSLGIIYVQTLATHDTSAVSKMIRNHETHNEVNKADAGSLPSADD
ncbi:MAG: hypothetical protein KKH95_13140, partial [Gammaproteobacteria bacterium]|nr:hypothetical protein [Gammaproteobacteria bacterium]